MGVDTLVHINFVKIVTQLKPRLSYVTNTLVLYNTKMTMILYYNIIYSNNIDKKKQSTENTPKKMYIALHSDTF